MIRVWTVLLVLSSLGAPLSCHGVRWVKGGRWAVCILFCIINTIMPMYMGEDVMTLQKVIVAFLYSWLANFKLLGYLVLGRGPLVDCHTLAHTFIVYNLPITPVVSVSPYGRQGDPKSVHRSNARQHETRDMSLYGWMGEVCSKMLLLFILNRIVCWIRPWEEYASLPILIQFVVELCDSLALYAFIGAVMGTASCILACLPYGASMKVAPHFDAPWLSASFTDFWSRRWNLNTGFTLRFLVYDVICDNSLVKLDDRDRVGCSKQRRAVAMRVSFAVSGLMHELFIYYLRSQVSGYWMAFFAIQGPLILLFDHYMGLEKKRRQLNGYQLCLARVMTISLQLLVAHYLFFPDIIRMGIPKEMHENVSKMFLGR